MEERKRSTEGFILSHDLQCDDEVLNMKPTVEVRPKVTCLDEIKILSVAKANICSQLQVRYCCHTFSSIISVVLCNCYFVVQVDQRPQPKTVN